MRNNYLKFITVVTILLASSLFIIPFSSSINAASSPSLYPSNINKALSVKWWQWLGSIPEDKNPITNNPCNIRQSGLFFYLVGTFGGSAERQCDILKGKSIFFPIVNVIVTLDRNDPDSDTISEVKKAAADFIDPARNLQASVDRVQIQNIGSLRTQSPPFNWRVSDDFGFEIPGGTYTAVTDRFWVALKSLNVGEHTIHFAGHIPEGEFGGVENLDVTYHISVK